ncbi:MAG: PKD domain-containing protein [Chloroflexi bacterium]|nr:PKD domain-containing protein [Chloroflexota bacterium]
MFVIGGVAYLQLRDGGGLPPEVQSLSLARDGRVIELAGSVQVGDSDLAQLQVDWGDGDSEFLPVDGADLQLLRSTHEYAADGSYQVRLIATFEDGSASSRVGTVVIPPETVATPLPPPAVTPSAQGAALAGAEPDETPEAEPTAEPASEPTPQVPPLIAPNPTATPAASATPLPQPTLPAGNQPPAVSILAVTPRAALAVTLAALATDPEGALVAVAIIWGDGQSEELGAAAGNITRSHSYAAPGDYTVSVVALDAAGNESVASAAVTAAE